MTDSPKYAQGGFIAAFDGSRGDSVPFLLSRGHTLMSYASYKALGPEGIRALFPNADIEVVFSADEVREFGGAALEKLQEQIVNRQDDELLNEPTGPLETVLREIKARMDGMECGRCHKPTGNNSQGHYWAFCKVTRTIREHHFCCPDDCALEATDGLQ